MKAKDYLQQMEKLNAIIQNKMIERLQWREIALGVTSYTEGERVQSSKRPGKMADALDRCVDIEKEIDSLIDKLIDTRKEIIGVIELLSATEYDVLHKRYIQGMTFDEIGAAKHKSKSWATTVHGRALQNLNKILEKNTSFSESM